MPGERRSLLDVPAQFRALNGVGERIGVAEGFGTEFRDKRYTVFHGSGGRNHHFQGVQRHAGHLLVTGGYPYPPTRADLLVFRLGSRGDAPGPWGSNLLHHRDPPPEDRLVQYFRLDEAYWHPGGFAMLGPLAVIPMEDSHGRSRIDFVDVADPAAPPVRARAPIERPQWKAGAVAATRLDDGRALLAVWSDSDRPAPGEGRARYHLDFYLLDADLGTADLVGQMYPEGDHPLHRKFQSLDFLWETRPGGASALYLAAFEHVAAVQPLPGQPSGNRAVLFAVDLGWLDASGPGGPRPVPAAAVEHVDTRVFHSVGDWCNMDAGACAYVDERQRLVVYSVHHYLAPIRQRLFLAARPVLRCLEFRSTLTPAISQADEAWIELYAGAGLSGRRIALVRPGDTEAVDARALWSQDERFASAGSARYQLPAGSAFVLYPESGYLGARVHVLGGTGRLTDVDLAVAGRPVPLGSYRIEPQAAAAALPGAVLL